MQTTGEWLTQEEAAARLGCSRSTIHRWVRAGALPKHAAKGRRFLRASDVDALAEKEPPLPPAQRRLGLLTAELGALIKEWRDDLSCGENIDRYRHRHLDGHPVSHGRAVARILKRWLPELNDPDDKAELPGLYRKSRKKDEVAETIAAFLAVRSDTALREALRMAVGRHKKNQRFYRGDAAEQFDLLLGYGLAREVPFNEHPKLLRQKQAHAAFKEAYPERQNPHRLQEITRSEALLRLSPLFKSQALCTYLQRFASKKRGKYRLAAQLTLYLMQLT